MFVCAECGYSDTVDGACAIDGARLFLASDPLLGISIGRYRLARQLGAGGMGSVYLGVQHAIRSRVAIKVLSEQCAKDAVLVERFFAEARAVNLINHEHIASVIDMDVLPDGRPFIVIEYIDGTTLGRIVREARAPFGGVVNVVREVLSALAAAHAIGIVHRDLKPDNVMITAEGHAKVLDFGIAKLAPGLALDRSPRTRTGAVLGTPSYMAPEQITGGEVDARADLYAAGVTLYECVTGKLPFQHATLFELMRAHVDDPPPSARAVRTDLPRAFEQVIERAMAKAPAARFQTASEMMQALDAAAAELPAEAWCALSSTKRGVPRVASVPPGIRALTPIAPSAYDNMPTHDDEPPRAASPRVDAARPTAHGRDRAAQPDLDGPAPAANERRNVFVIAGIAVGVAALVASTIAITLVLARDPEPRVVVASPGDARATESDPATVHIGDGVNVGTAQVRSTSDAKQFTVPATYDPTRFDMLAFLPEATRLARRMLGDARLSRITMYNVRPDGTVDLRPSSRHYPCTYMFRSEIASSPPSDLPRGATVDPECRVEVMVGPRDVLVRMPIAGWCDIPFVEPPRCSVDFVWKRAVADGVSRATVARVDLWKYGKPPDAYTAWELIDADGQSHLYPDDCK